jgi:hypothetical protein
MSRCAYNSEVDNKCLHLNTPHGPHCPYIDEKQCKFFSESTETASGIVFDYPGVNTALDELEKKRAKPVESLEKNVNHPKRYTKGKIECIDALESAVVGKTPEEAICVANVIKYLWRYEEKEPLRSLKSAEWYLKRLISKYEANDAHHD